MVKTSHFFCVRFHPDNKKLRDTALSSPGDSKVQAARIVIAGVSRP